MTPIVNTEKRYKEEAEQAEREAQLYQQIGQLKVELDCALGAPEKSWHARSLNGER